MLCRLPHARPLPRAAAASPQQKNMTANTRAPEAGWQHHSGEVGLLAEEGPQRLLDVFAETAMVCLAQIVEMTLSHGRAKFGLLYGLGLDLVATWDRDVIQEECVRMEHAYPEVGALHSFSYLFLLDKLFSDRDLHAIGVPPMLEAYAAFMRRVAKHTDVRKGRAFLDAPCAARRVVFLECFRGAYHDLVQATCRAPAKCAAVPVTSALCLEAGVLPEEAASQVSRRAPPSSHMLLQTPVAGGLEASSCAPRSALASAVERETQQPRAPSAEHDEGSTTGRDASETQPAAGTVRTRQTKAVTVSGPCFFAQDAA